MSFTLPSMYTSSFRPVHVDQHSINSNERSSKRMRISRACDKCRKKKVKCELFRGEPCGNCAALGTECEFTESAKKRGPPKGYIDVLEQKIRRIESLVQKMPPSSTPPQQVVGEKHQQGSSTDRVRYVGDTSLLQLLQSKIPFGSLDDVGPKGKYRQFGSQIVHIANDENVDGRCDRAAPELFRMPSGINAWIYTYTGADKYTSDRLLQIYFLNIHPLLPIINKTEFLRQYRDQANTYPPIVLLNAMFGAAARFIVAESLKQRRQDRFVPPDLTWNGSREWANRFFDQAFGSVSDTSCGTSISKVQAIILVHNTNSNISNQEATAWNLNGMAIRLAQAFCLNRSVEDWDIPESDKELRKRVWWALHITDRFQSTALGRPLSIREEDNDVSYPDPCASWKEVLDDPVDDDDDATPRFPSATYRPESTDGEVEIYQFFTQLIKLSEILGRILQGLYTPKAREYSITQGSDVIVAGLDNELTKWRFGFPRAMKNSNFKDFDDQSGYFAPAIASTLMCYCACLILLHRPFIEKQDSHLGAEARPAFLSVRISSSAASRGISIAEHMTIRDFIMFPFAFSIYPLFQFCLIHIYNTRSPDGQIAASGQTELRKGLRVVDRLRDLSSLSRLLYDVVRLITESLQTNIDMSTPNSSATAANEPQPNCNPAYSSERIQKTVAAASYEKRHEEEPWDSVPVQPQQQAANLPDGNLANLPYQFQAHTTNQLQYACPEVYTLKQFGFKLPNDPNELDIMLQDIASYSRVESLSLPLHTMYDDVPSDDNERMPSCASKPSGSGITPNSTFPSSEPCIVASPLQAPATIDAMYYKIPPLSARNYGSSNTGNSFSEMGYTSHIPIQEESGTNGQQSHVSNIFRNNPDNPFGNLSSSMDFSEWYAWTQRNNDASINWPQYRENML